MKYLGANLTKYVQDLYEENYKSLMKEIKELNKWRDTPCSWVGRLRDDSTFKTNLQCNGIPLKCQQYYLMKPADSKVHIQN